MRRRASAAVALGAVLALAGCAPVVSLTPAPQATSVGCAGVVVRLPSTIGTQQMRNTDAQGTAAWGTPASVTLRCGLDPVVASTDPCYPIEGIQWLYGDTGVRGDERRVATTFGRDPAVQVIVGSQSSVNDVLPAITDAVRAATRSTGLRCFASGATVPPTPAPTSTSTPTPTP